MARMRHVKPAHEGLILPMPNGRDLPADGLSVDFEGPDGLFWARREAEQDIQVADPDVSDASEASATETNNE